MTQNKRDIHHAAKDGSMEGTASGKRLCFLDALRIMAACAVVLLHTVTGISDNTDMGAFPREQAVFFLVRDYVTWCVPVFIMISGYLFLDPGRSISLCEMLCKYCRRIVLALFLFGTPYACMELVVVEQNFRAGMLWESVLRVLKGQSWSHMWYLYLILLLYLVTPALKAALGRCPGWLPCAALAGIFVGSSILPFVENWRGLGGVPSLPGDFIYLFYYLCGYLSVAWGRKKNRGAAAPLAAIILVFFLISILASMTAVRMAGCGIQLAYNYPFTVCLSLALFWLAEAAEDIWRKKERLLKSMGGLCFTVYLVHPVFVNFFYKFLHISPLDFPIGASLPVFFAVILALSVGAAWILRRIPLLRRYVL